MPLRSPSSAGRLSSVLAGLMIGLMLFLGVVAASEQLHSQIHADTSAKHGTCSYCSVAKGQVDSPGLLPGQVCSASLLVWTVPFGGIIRPQPADFSVASSRGPPVSISLL